MQKGYCALLGAGALSALCYLALPAAAQTTINPDNIRAVNRITQRIDDGSRVPLRLNRPPLARPEFDAGRMPAEAPMHRMMLSLAPDPSQQQALETLLEAQQDPQSPSYHRWLTPEEFGSRFGVSESDLQTVATWLESKGFQVEPVSAGRRAVIFTGTAGQVESAFHTQMRAYQVNGRLHHANATATDIPAALAKVVSGFVSLDDFAAAPAHAAPLRVDAAPSPDYAMGSAHYLAPADLAAIYDLGPLYTGGIDGRGTAIAVIGRSNINLSDVQSFRSRMGLPPNDPKIVIAGGTAPGIVPGDQDEATLDVEWAGAVARNATVELVTAASTSASDGVMLAAQYAVNQNVAPVISLSFDSCESALGYAGNQFMNGLWQQAAAQGISVLVSSGDSGAAACSSPSSSVASGNAAVNGLCSSPFSTCVGGTQFNDVANPLLYWAAATNAGPGGSALTYIPEAAWNESSLAPGGSGLWAGGGGASIIYPKPSWQTGAGVPASNQRYVPDVALSASAHNGYLVTLNGQLYAFAGTSASAPSFAGVVTLVVARQGVRQGNINPALYALAAQQRNGGPTVFHDVTAGGNSVSGVTGFSATAGYDLATGLGSVDGSLMVNDWANASKLVPAMKCVAVTAGPESASRPPRSRSCLSPTPSTNGSR
jgi:subtilase family serine protease